MPLPPLFALIERSAIRRSFSLVLRTSSEAATHSATLPTLSTTTVPHTCVVSSGLRRQYRRLTPPLLWSCLRSSRVGRLFLRARRRLHSVLLHLARRQDHCAPRETCSSISYASQFFTLSESAVKSFHELDGLNVHAIKLIVFFTRAAPRRESIALVAPTSQKLARGTKGGRLRRASGAPGRLCSVHAVSWCAAADLVAMSDSSNHFLRL